MLYLFIGRYFLAYLAIVCSASFPCFVRRKTDPSLVRLPRYKPSYVGRDTSSLPRMSVSAANIHIGRAAARADLGHHHHHCEYTTTGNLGKTLLSHSGRSRDYCSLDHWMHIQLGIDSSNCQRPCDNHCVVLDYNTFGGETVCCYSGGRKRGIRCRSRDTNGNPNGCSLWCREEDVIKIQRVDRPGLRNE